MNEKISRYLKYNNISFKWVFYNSFIIFLTNYFVGFAMGMALRSANVNNAFDNTKVMLSFFIVSYLSYKYGNLFTLFMEKNGSKLFTTIGILIVVICLIIYFLLK